MKDNSIFPWVDKGIFKGTCCGFNRKRVTMELPKLQSGSIEEAIGEFFRNTTCDCPRAVRESEAGELLESVRKIDLRIGVKV